MAPGILVSDDHVMEDAPSSPNEDSPSDSPAAFPVGDPPSDSSDKENRKAALEDMFDDDDDDEEFLSSAVNAADGQKPSMEVDHKDPEVMRIFYQRLFPFRHVFQWLNHSLVPGIDMAHREFAFTLPNDAYLRYLSFPTADLWRKECVQKVPPRFEVGAVYSTNPREHKSIRKSSMYRPISKELCFDIDMDAYDPIRTCCSGSQVCKKCWTFIVMAIKVLDAALKDDFGFNHILWVFSGRRGAHAWVCDRRAREMDDSRRRAIVGYLDLLRGGDQAAKRVNVKRPLHPHLERSLRILREYFLTNVLHEQDPWESEEKAAELLKLLPDKELSDALEKKWGNAPGRSSVNKWADIDALASAGASSTLDTKALRDAKQDIVFEYTYPRLDGEVSKKMNHLLKSPFCIHPKTGTICVPIDVRTVEEFDPLQIPNVLRLLSEIDKWHEENDTEGDGPNGPKKIADWEKTSLKPYVEYFKGFVAGLLKDEKAVKRERTDADTMEF